MVNKKSNKVNRAELVDAFAMKLGISKSQAERFLNSFVDTITDKLIAGFDINITGFGLFKTVSRRSRIGINPKTKEKMEIKGSKSVGFRVGKTLREIIRKSK